MKIFKKNKKNLTEQEYKKIEKSKNIIKEQKNKIKQEKEKIQEEKYHKFCQTKMGKFLNKLFLIDDKKAYQDIKKQVFSIIYYEVLGAILCLLVLFALTGGKNYFKLYYELNKLVDTYDAITKEYYGSIDKKKLVDNAISTMVGSVDDTFTNYNNKTSTNNFMEQVMGTYEGIGATITTDDKDNKIIAEVFDNSPAKKAGLKVKDIVLKVDGKDYTKKETSDIADYIKTSKNHQVKLTILRDNKEKTITIIRQKIKTPTVSGKVFQQEDKKIGYIYISTFTSVTTEQFKKQLTKLEKKQIDGLIIDVRNNSGGYLSTVTDISNLFLKKGQTIYQLSDKTGTIKIKDDTKERRTYPIAVLINHSSASASEILSSAIKESYDGHVVGTNSYGKGTVQKTKTLKDGSMIKYTIQKWLTPKGNWINEKGVTPTEKVELDQNKDEDNQLAKAKEVIIKDLKK